MPTRPTHTASSSSSGWRMSRAATLRRIETRARAPHTSATETLEALELVVVSPICASWNQLTSWLRRLDGLRGVPDRG